MPQLTPKLFRKKLSGVCVCGEREREKTNVAKCVAKVLFIIYSTSLQD